MFSALRTRYGIPGLIATAALVFAMTGGAFAAKYLITSTKQISPSVLKKLKGAAGPAGAQGPAGAAGAKGDAGAAGQNGAVGPTGPKGATGSQGIQGEKGATGSQGIQGEPGEDGETGFTATLPSGETEAGSWTAVVAAQIEIEGQFFGVGWGAIPFNIPLTNPLDEEHVAVVQDDQEGQLGQCSDAAETTKGTATNPLASPGFLCVYVGGTASEQAKPWFIRKADGSPGNGASTSGAYVVIGGTEGPFAPAGELAFGTYAVTAP